MGLVDVIILALAALFVMEVTRWAWGFWRPSHTCQIGARLEIGSLPIEGQITVVKGQFCHFRPVDDATYRMLRHYAESEASRLYVGESSVSAEVCWLRKGVAGCRLLEPHPNSQRTPLRLPGH